MLQPCCPMRIHVCTCNRTDNGINKDEEWFFKIFNENIMTVHMWKNTITVNVEIHVCNLNMHILELLQIFVKHHNTLYLKGRSLWTRCICLPFHMEQILRKRICFLRKQFFSIKSCSPSLKAKGTKSTLILKQGTKWSYM